MTQLDRREFVRAVAAGTALSVLPGRAQAEEEKPMYGLIGKMKVAPGQRDAVVSALLEGTRSMPGCLSYIVAHDPADPEAIWVTEAWTRREHHQASLKLPAVQEAIARTRPHITGFGERFETIPIGGTGLGGSDRA